VLVRMRVPAKINLDLRVGARRPDGYHDVSTVMQAVALFDRLALRAARGGPRLRCSGCPAPAGPDNLAYRAALLAARAAGRPPDVAIHLRKRIPAAAGLGGASADAAATLLGLVALWSLPWGRAELCALAAELGSDVPFFLLGGTVRASGRGERLQALPAEPARPVLIVKPPFGVATADAYAWFDQAPSRGEANDLEPAVLARHPELAAAKQALLAAGAARVALTGSGSALFALLPSLRRARREAAAWRQRGWWACATRFWPGGAERVA
jgi:4-diphosphocytidyl-2-C-methyl-D-erythritol kinase